MYVQRLSLIVLIKFLSLNFRVSLQSEVDDFIPPPGNRPCNLVLKVQDLYLQTKSIGKKYGFDIESHNVRTEDGYIIEIHRIPNPGKPVVYIQYGLFQSSRDQLINCDRRAAAVRFADEGLYDVWLGNTRGNLYGRKHEKISSRDEEFWDFSNDEIIRIDTPTVIDYVLNTTKQAKLSFVGFSMGNAHMLGLLALKPEYAQKINFVFSMGATAKFSNTKSPFIRLMAPYSKFVERAFTQMSNGEVTSRSLAGLMNRIGPYLCFRESVPLQNRASISPCLAALAMNDGYDPGQIDGNVFAAVIAAAPSGGSIKMFTHWLQWVNSDRFAMFDHGYLKNMKMYGQEHPPLYNISEIPSKVYIFYGENDWVTTPEDVKASVRMMKNATLIKVESPTWNHVDFPFGKDSSHYVYDRMLKILKNENRKMLRNAENL